MQRFRLSPSLWLLFAVMSWHVAAMALLSSSVPLTAAAASPAYTQAQQSTGEATCEETRSPSSELCLRCKDFSKQGLTPIRLASCGLASQQTGKPVFLLRQNPVVAPRLHSFPRKLPPPTSAEDDIVLS